MFKVYFMFPVALLMLLSPVLAVGEGIYAVGPLPCSKQAKIGGQSVEPEQIVFTNNSDNPVRLSIDCADTEQASVTVAPHSSYIFTCRLKSMEVKSIDCKKSSGTFSIGGGD